MMKLFTNIVMGVTVFVLTLAVFHNSFAQPFGLEMGMSMRQLERKGIEVESQGRNEYYTKEVIKNHPDFESYVLGIHPQTGLCYFRAIGKNLKTSPHGTEIRNKFDSLVSQLSKSYGNGLLNSFLKHGSIWDESRDFTMGLLEKERILQYVWDKEEGSDVRHNLDEVILGASVLKTDTAFLILQYRFSNYAECTRLREESEASIL